MYVMSVQHFACMHSDFDMILNYLKAHNFKVLSNSISAEVYSEQLGNWSTVAKDMF